MLETGNILIKKLRLTFHKNKLNLDTVQTISKIPKVSYKKKMFLEVNTKQKIQVSLVLFVNQNFKKINLLFHK